MIGLMYFPFFIPVFTVHFRDQLHLISSCWVINPGRVHLQTLGASWVTSPHASSSTGCVFTRVGSSCSSQNFGGEEDGFRFTCLCAGHADRTLSTGHSSLGICHCVTSLQPVKPEKSAFQKIPTPGLWERREAACGLCHAASDPPHQLLGEKVSRVLQQTCPALLAYQTGLGIIIDSRGLNAKGFREETSRKIKEKVSEQCQHARCTYMREVLRG